MYLIILLVFSLFIQSSSNYSNNERVEILIYQPGENEKLEFITLELKVSFDKNINQLDQIIQCCDYLSQKNQIIDCFSKVKLLIALTDINTIKIFKIDIRGRKYDITLKDVFIDIEFDNESNRICNLYYQTNINGCLKMIADFQINIINSIRSLNPKEVPLFSFHSSDIDWYNYTKNDFFIDNYDLNSYIILNNQNNIFENKLPWPHAVLDNYFDTIKLKEVTNEIIEKNDYNDNYINSWRKFNDKDQHKYGTSNPFHMGEKTKQLISELKSVDFVNFLEGITGLAGLIPDPYDVGGGVHLITKGGYLKVHTDFPFHSQIRLWRRVNILLYLNDNWDDNWGGQLELWNSNLSSSEIKISPIFNRLVIFRTDNKSFHGHPSPLATPNEHILRKSIALYYYSSDIDPGNSMLKQTTNFTDI
jgi:Rps23 Pro-64 3,4-dihydroxylase Tpa1-like proline 4-hydroxylase